jgi:hypothetical protein
MVSFVTRKSVWLSTILRERIMVRKVKPGAAKVAPVRVTPKQAKQPVE